ncbi:MAG TPA: tRNA uracil 4-sulfurtransferase ThiI [Bacilli bacterium]|nr:tRNA uracil 4-sulfurtransferase ThiI [Bacilli bacterium]
MDKLIIIKYGELSTKKDNINFFIDCLNKNIKLAVNDLKLMTKFDRGRMFIMGEEEQLNKAINALKKVFGIHEMMIGYKINSDQMPDIEQTLVTLLKEQEFNTFKVETKRSNKAYPGTSLAISKHLGGIILKALPNKQVAINHPELLVTIEIRKEGTYFYYESIPGLGGYPVGVQGKGLLMLSGGIDSPVAGYLAIKRGVKLAAVYFESPPHTSVQAKNKVLKLAKILAPYNNDIKVHIINFTKIQEAIYQNIPRDYLITIMRRMMYRISAIINYNMKGHVIINGESIGQVASQTLASMKAINEVVKIPVIRPVACFDKLEIIRLAEQIGTYETSILPYEDCCTIFVPEHPVIKPSITKCLAYEKLIPYEELIYEAVANQEVIKVVAKEEKEVHPLL